MTRLPANLLTFDIEGFIEASHDSVNVPSHYVSAEAEAREVEENTHAILDLLAEFDQRATFFILGRIARDMPRLIRRIAEADHEIGCHSYEHRRVFNFSRPEVSRFLADAKALLEDAGGRRVDGFRAPDFSITRKNLWAFDVLRELGFLYDSSVMPTGIHDVYGIGDFPRVPFVMSNGLVEVPLSTQRVWRHNIPFGGGGYLRLYPLRLTRILFRFAHREGVPCVVYLHPFEVGPIVPRIHELGLVRRFRTYVGVKSGAAKLRALLRAFAFTPVIDYLQAERLLEMST